MVVKSCSLFWRVLLLSLLFLALTTALLVHLCALTGQTFPAFAILLDSCPLFWRVFRYGLHLGLDKPDTSGNSLFGPIRAHPFGGDSSFRFFSLCQALPALALVVDSCPLIWQC